MLNLLRLFAAEDKGPAIHIAPGEIFKIGDISITNSMIYGWACALFILVLFVTVRHGATLRPKRGLIQFVEAGVEFIISLITNSLGSREKAIKYAPYFAAIFFYVLLNNWFGLLPGVGEAVRVGETPLLRAFTADLNGTLAAAIVTMVLVQTFAIKESGILRHIRHYFSGSLKNPATYLFGALEVFTEFTRIISLALRLFLNVVIGEIIISVFAYLGSGAAPLTSLPFVALELMVAMLQAYIFVMLSVTYLAVAIKHDHADEHASNDHESVPEESVPSGKGQMVKEN
ncbi:F0F1 ATP synthase subunit A [Candidatus Saccharibacteria bacterium]|nr:F0F1 ATP synthase subunit A [Candidatus Saccharibacteria bacterium]